MNNLKEAPAAFYQGIEEFNSRRFFECHETLEEIWNAEPSELRRLYQGILQIATAFYHATVRQNFRGATRLLETGMAWLEPFLPSTFGADLADLVQNSAKALHHIQTLGPARMAEFDTSYIPQIRLVESK
jgi:predicted metal-dependent hydrolase